MTFPNRRIGGGKIINNSGDEKTTTAFAIKGEQPWVGILLVRLPIRMPDLNLYDAVRGITENVN